jgi:hypothetical protein
VQDENQAFIDSLPTDSDDKMYMQIHHWARQSYARHKSLVAGQMITAGDASDTHIIWATLRWAKENAPPAQPAVPLTDEQINDIWNAKDNPQHRTTLSPWGLDRIRAIIKAALSTPPAAPVPLTDGVTVPLEVLEAAEESLGSFCSDHGWSDKDMQNMDNLSAHIARHKAAHGITKGGAA